MYGFKQCSFICKKKSQVFPFEKPRLKILFIAKEMKVPE